MLHVATDVDPVPLVGIWSNMLNHWCTATVVPIVWGIHLHTFILPRKGPNILCDALLVENHQVGYTKVFVV